MIKHVAQSKKMLKQFVFILVIILYASGCYNSEYNSSYEYSISDYTFDKQISGILLSAKTDSAIIFATDYGLTNLNVYTGKVDSTPLVWEYVSHDSVYYFNYPISWRRVDGDDNNLVSANFKNYYCYLYSMSADTAHLHISKLQKSATSHILFKKTMSNGDDILINALGEVFFRSMESSEWECVNVFNDFTRSHVKNLAFDENGLLFSNMAGEIFYLRFDSDLKCETVWSSDANNIVIYKNRDNVIRVVIGNMLYGFVDGKLDEISKLDGVVASNGNDTTITATGIYKDMIVSYQSGNFIVDNDDNVAIYEPDQYTLNTLSSNYSAFIFNNKILLHNLNESNIYEVIEEWPNKQ
jgi:hypothetical protein